MKKNHYYITFTDEVVGMRFEADTATYAIGGVEVKGRWVSNGILGAETRDLFFPYHRIEQIELVQS